jgi:putative transposase
MGRELRVQVAGGVYHLTARGNRRQRLFEDDRDRNRFLQLLSRVIEDCSWACLGYCLMPNHYPVVIEIDRPNLSAGMHRLNSAYAQWFNRRHNLDGHLFQGRFHAVSLERTWHLIHLSRYLALNPVASGLCASPSDWPWGSYRYIVTSTQPPRFLAVDRVLSLFGTPEITRGSFHRYVVDGL